MASKIASKSLDVKINLPLIFLASVFPDIDLLVPGLFHRGPLHSIIIYCLFFLPIFLLYRKKAVPYFFAVIQHLIIGDYITGDIQLLWPITNAMYSLDIGIASLTNVAMEWALFLTSITIMVKTNDVLPIIKHHPSNLILLVPVLTVLLPTVISFPLYVPPALLIPHLVYLIIFGFSILSDLKTILRKT